MVVLMYMYHIALFHCGRVQKCSESIDVEMYKSMWPEFK